MGDVTSINPNLVNQIRIDLPDTGTWGKAAETIGDSLARAENDLIAEWAKPEDKRNEGDIQKLTMKYERAKRMLEAFMNLFQSKKQTEQQLTRNLGPN